MLCIASISCCVAMAMPQVHIVAYCGDLGYGVARGAEMLSLMMAFGVVSRIGSGFLADKIGGIRTLLIGSVAQGFALLFYLFFDGLTSLYIISAMFGLFQGGIVPSYAIIVRESMPASEAGTRVGLVIFASVFGMSFGGWVSGVIFDASGSYAAAFLNGLALECAQHHHHGGAVDPGALAAGDGVTRGSRFALCALAHLDQDAASDLEAAVRLLLQRIQRIPWHAVGIDDANPLGDLAVGSARFAKFETLVAIDRGVAVLDHAQEYIGLRKHLVNSRRRVGIGRCGIVAAERLDLGADDALRGGDIVGGASRRGETEEQGQKQKSGSHGGLRFMLNPAQVS